MFCPRCGQQQASEEIRFCSRCGFPLTLIGEILAAGGSLPETGGDDKKQRRFFSRTRGWKFGLTWFLVLTFFFAPLLAILGVDAIPEIAAALGVFGGILMTGFSFIFLKNDPPSRAARHPEGLTGQPAGGEALGGKTNQNFLPPQQSVPASAYAPPAGPDLWKAPDTNNLTGPGSVTEGTTKLLERDE